MNISAKYSKREKLNPTPVQYYPIVSKQVKLFMHESWWFL